jgi:hypothetical protein
MALRQWAWLIGMTDADDHRPRQWAKSFSQPPSLEVHGAAIDFQSYVPQRRALRLRVQDQDIAIKLRPASVCVNPVFELLGAPKGALTVTRDGVRISSEDHAWDGRTLWLDATIKEPTELRFAFSGRTD